MSLTTEQHAAITSYAQRHGRTWKASLRHAWMTGYYPDPNDNAPALQQIRNCYGPSWLVRFRVPLPVIPSEPAAYEQRSHTEALHLAQLQHQPHSLIESRRHWQQLATAPGVTSWGYAYDGGAFEKQTVEIEDEAGNIDLCEVEPHPGTRVLRILRRIQHAPQDDSGSAYAAQYAYACGYHN